MPLNVTAITEAIKVLEPALRSRGKTLDFDTLNREVYNPQFNELLSNEPERVAKAVGGFADRSPHTLTKDSRDDNQNEINSWTSSENPNPSQTPPSQIMPQNTLPSSEPRVENTTQTNWQTGPLPKTSSSSVTSNSIGSAMKKIL